MLNIKSIQLPYFVSYLYIISLTRTAIAFKRKDSFCISKWWQMLIWS